MDTIKAVFDYTLKEHLRHKAWLSAALFGVALLAGGLVASALGQEERGRLMLDLGLAANEALAMVSAVFLTVHLVLQEIESRAIFLILTHPVARWQYLLGRWLGTVAAVGLAMAGMGAAHLLALQAFGGAPLLPYLGVLGLAFAKTAVMAALALLLSLALTSEAAAMAFSGFFFVLGHFAPELRFLAEKSGSVPVRTVMVAFSHAAPDFSRLTPREAWSGGLPDPAWFALAFLYAAAYAAACLALSTQVFEQKEF
ncbi:MAG: ABC transporter permease subunit [Elusimicrobiota bacterium]|nr:ABC transporter permease subunit [Elusimicrobiota bacterium]